MDLALRCCWYCPLGILTKKAMCCRNIEIFGLVFKLFYFWKYITKTGVRNTVPTVLSVVECRALSHVHYVLRIQTQSGCHSRQDRCTLPLVLFVLRLYLYRLYFQYLLFNWGCIFQINTPQAKESQIFVKLFSGTKYMYQHQNKVEPMWNSYFVKWSPTQLYYSVQFKCTLPIRASSLPSDILTSWLS